MKLFTLALMIFAVMALAYVVGSRIPAETVALGLGIVLGALASIPLSLFVQALFSGADQPADLALQPAHQAVNRPPYPRTDGYGATRDYPPLVIINPSSFENARQPAYAAVNAQSLLIPSGPREFRVVGEEST